MKLAFITHNYPLTDEDRSNAGIFVADIARSLAKKGHSISVFVVNASVTKRRVFFSGRLVVHFIADGSLKKSLGTIKLFNIYDVIRVFKLFFLSREKIISIMKDEAYDFCLAFWAIPSGILAYQVASTTKIPYGIWALGSDIYVYQKYPIIGDFIKRAAQRSALLFADGIDLAKVVSKTTKHDCQFLPSATTFPTSTLSQILLDPRRVNFVFLGRMEPVKGPDIFLKALTLLQKSLNYHAYLLGGGILQAKLYETIIDHRLEDKITMLGNVDDKNIIFSYLAKSDFLIIPSRSDSIPLVLGEGAKAGTPVIVSNVGDMEYLIKKYNIGYVFPSENVRKLAKILEARIKQAKEEKKEFKNNLKRFAKVFNNDKIAIELIQKIKQTK